MKLHFLGANRQVTGSRYGLEIGGRRVLVDCGMFQERKFEHRNWEPCPIPAADIDALLLTHAHIDHCGLIPRLVREGFAAPIYATPPTADLAEILLRDSARIQEEDAANKARRHHKEGRLGSHPEVPLYFETHVERALERFLGRDYGQAFEPAAGLSVTFRDAGHILGSAMIEVEAAESGLRRRIVFSGDVGQWDKPLLRDPAFIDNADYVIMESTYGDREHEQTGGIEDHLARVINETAGRGGNVVIPIFAVERAQEVMYFLGGLVHADRIPDIPIFLDSPMAIDVTAIFQRHRGCYDEEAWERIVAGRPPLHFPGLRMARTTEESRAINQVNGPCVIMSTSGMCTAGRIKHHLRHNLPRHQSTVLFVGYQAHGTLGRQILEGGREVRIHGKDYPVRAQVERIYGFSGHADRPALLKWLSHFTQPPRRVFLTHGEESAALSLAQEIERTLGWTVAVPEYGDAVTLE